MEAGEITPKTTYSEPPGQASRTAELVKPKPKISARRSPALIWANVYFFAVPEARPEGSESILRECAFPESPRPPLSKTLQTYKIEASAPSLR